MRHLGVGGPAQTGGATDFGAVNKFHPGLVANSEIVDFGRQGAPHHVTIPDRRSAGRSQVDLETRSEAPCTSSQRALLVKRRKTVQKNTIGRLMASLEKRALM
jgi:hypothetical protein